MGKQEREVSLLTARPTDTTFFFLLKNDIIYILFLTIYSYIYYCGASGKPVLVTSFVTAAIKRLNASGQSDELEEKRKERRELRRKEKID